jgi:hypothetical protein
MELTHNKAIKCAPATEVAGAGHYTTVVNMCLTSFSHKLSSLDDGGQISVLTYQSSSFVPIMVRPLRIEYENAFYHLMNRGRGRRGYFMTRTTMRSFLKYR